MQNEDKAKISPKIKSAAKAAKDAVVSTAEKSKDVMQKSQQAMVDVIDLNGDGQIDIEDIIIWGLRTPGIRVDRENFLRKELFKNFEPDVIEDAVRYSPAHAHIPIEDIDKIADEVVKFERNCVTGISTALGMPGGAAMAATIPADIIQYYGYMLRATQKLLYLYGFPEIDTSVKGQTLDSATLNVLIICLGVMYGVAGANKALMVMARALADGVEKKLLRAALTKGAIFPIVRKVALWFNVHMTKALFAGVAKKAIPVIGGAIGGTITFLSFKPCCDKLRKSLHDTALTDPNHVVSSDVNDIIDALEVTNIEEAENDLPSKHIVAFFSATGVTAKAANDLAEAVGADVFEIQPAKRYTEADLNWKDEESRSSLEMNDPSARPQIAAELDHMEEYDVIYVGFPIWWYAAPRIINTFLESYDLTGKTVIPFATSGGSGVEKVNESLRESCAGAKLMEPHLLNDTQALNELAQNT